MKKGIAAISLLVYLLVTSGVVVNAHYCMDRLASVHLFGETPDVCGQCGMDMHESNNCCHDETGLVKMDQDQNKIPVVLYEIPAPEALPATPSGFILAAFYNFPGQRHFHNHSPPLLSGQDRYLQNNVFLI